MKKIIIILLFSLLIFVSKNLFAFGIGGYISAGCGVTTYESYLNQEDYDGHFLGGVVFDTNLSGKSFFNYRVKLGYGTNIADPMYHRLNLINTFGLGLIRDKQVRYWVGVTIGASYLYNKTYEDDPLHFAKVEVGATLIGLNINIKKITLSVEMGLEFDFILSNKETILIGKATQGKIEVSFFYRIKENV